MRRSGSASIVANPVLVGAVTTLVVVVAVFLAYNANNGLPFVPTTQLRVQLANGANLVPGNEVRTGGFRIGVVEDMRPVQLPGGRVGAELVLKLDKVVGEIPVDTRITVRPRSALGLKYVELDKGRSRRTFRDGDTLPATQARIPVELDEFYNMFDADTREAAKRNLLGYGNAFAGRGADLNATIVQAPPFFSALDGVMSNLADPRTRLETLFTELADFTRVLAPVSQTNARLFTSLADTFEAFSRDPEALKATISRSPATLAAGTRSLRVQRPFLERTAAFSADLEVAAVELRRALPSLSEALRVGARVQARSPRLNRPLERVLASAERLVDAPTTLGALNGLEATIATVHPQLRYLGPYVTVCNAFTNFWTTTAEHFTAPDDTGSSERALLNSSSGYPQGSDHVGNAGANEFAHGVRNQQGVEQWLHGNFYPPAVNSKGRAECAAGNNGYVASANPYRDRSNGDPYRRAVVDDFDTVQEFGPVFDQLVGDGSRGEGAFATRIRPDQTFAMHPAGLGQLADKAKPVPDR